MPLILPARTLDSGYKISNSLRFNDDDSPRLALNPASTGNQDRWTLSLWVKRSTLGAAQCFFASTDGSATSFDAKFDANDSLDVYNYLGGGFGARLVTNRKFRDVSAWYNILIVYDSGNSTEAQRLRIYVNGTEESSFSTTNYPSLNEDSDINVNGSTVEIGRQGGGSQFFDGYMAEIFLIDGTVYSPTDFGETNDNGVWIPKDAKGNLTFGTNGFYMEFQQTGTSANSSGMGADTSGNDNHFTPTNLTATDQTTDTPTNNFATLNPLDKDGHTNAEGNLQVSGNVIYGMQRGTMGASSGKWYFEARVDTAQNDTAIALANEDENVFTRFSGETTNSVGYLADGRFFYNSSSTSYSSLTGGDIFQMAFDADTGKIWIGKNNTWQNSGDPANGTNPVQTVSWNFFLPAARTVGSGVLSFNFGNPSFAISSGNADANGYGNFEYAVPSGYYALCTKNLAEYG